MEYQNYQTSVYPSIFYRVYAWMCTALIITGIVAYFGAYVEPINSYVKTNFGIIFLLSVIGQLIIVFTLSFAIMKLQFSTAIILFYIFSFLMGLTFTSVFYVYTFSSLISTFFIAAGMFGLMALYGAYTKTDLTRLNSLLYMVLLGLIIALVVNLFLRSSVLDIILSLIGVILFSVFTAVSVQNIKKLSHIMIQNNEALNKIALFGALSLYLNFINLFINLLRLLGTRRE